MRRGPGRDPRHRDPRPPTAARPGHGGTGGSSGSGEADEAANAAAPWTPGGTALVTGAADTIAGTTARWLAGRGARNLVLAGRSGPDAPGAARLAAALAEAGATVGVLRADLAAPGQAAGLLDWIARGRTPLTSVFHTEGAEQAAAVADTTVADLAEALRTRTWAAIQLDRLTRALELELDAFVLFSSISATWGSARQPGPAAANAFLDALAQRRAARAWRRRRWLGARGPGSGRRAVTTAGRCSAAACG
ncbi:SDR family oxidoreductase [Streptacidiphilus sp. 4-A2]|nr:SDR family oxidoreductase [Streptacidiphilus sp. 4-A2]